MKFDDFVVVHLLKQVLDIRGQPVLKILVVVVFFSVGGGVGVLQLSFFSRGA